MTKPIVIRTKKQEPDEHHPEGVAADQEFEVESLAVAKRVYPGATVLRYADGAEWDGPATAGDESEADEEAITLSRMTRVDLDAFATKHGIESPGDFPNKEALIAAIEGAS